MAPKTTVAITEAAGTALKSLVSKSFGGHGAFAVSNTKPDGRHPAVAADRKPQQDI